GHGNPEELFQPSPANGSQQGSRRRGPHLYEPPLAARGRNLLSIQCNRKRRRHDLASGAQSGLAHALCELHLGGRRHVNSFWPPSDRIPSPEECSMIASRYLPLLLASLGAVYLMMAATPAKDSPDGMLLEEFGRIPVSHDGRVK